MSKYHNPITGAVESHTRHSVLQGFDFMPGRIDNFVLHWPEELDFPFVIECQGASVSGEIYFDIDPGTLEALDVIEGITSGYFERKVVRVHTYKGVQEAFVYAAGRVLRNRFTDSPGYERVRADRP